MRETNLSKPIDRTDVKVGDKIRVYAEVVVEDVRESMIGLEGNRRGATIVNGNIAVDETISVTLLERDKPSEIVIPASATHIFWQDEDGYDHYARRNEVDEWTTSEGPEYTYTTEALISEIENESGEFDVYKPGSFQVLKHKYAAGYATGGFTGLPVGGAVGSPISLSSEAIAALSRQVGANILPRIGSL